MIIKRRHCKARKEYRCDDCHKKINVDEYYIYLFGMAHQNEKPYPLHICELCDYENSEVAMYEL